MYDYDDDSFPMGDARRCPAHPHVRTSSNDGLHDAPCGECEHEIWLNYDMLEESEETDTEPMSTPHRYTEKELLASGMAEYLLADDKDDVPF